MSLFENFDNPILSQKVKNAIKKADPDTEYTFTLKNILVNEQKRGCSGFIRNGEAVVYINTEPSVSYLPSFMARYATDEKDFRGFRNRFYESLPEMVEDVVNMLKIPVSETPESKLR